MPMSQGNYADKVGKEFVEGHYNIEGNIGLFKSWQLGTKLPKRKYKRVIKKPLSSSFLKYLNTTFAGLVENIQIRHVLIKIAVDFYFLHRLNYCPCERDNLKYEQYVHFAYASYYGMDKASKRFNKDVEYFRTHVYFYNSLYSRQVSLKIIDGFKWLFG